jgi:hypothetical protein
LLNFNFGKVFFPEWCLVLNDAEVFGALTIM